MNWQMDLTEGRGALASVDRFLDRDQVIANDVL